jgi:peptide/nickel transport system permease protein
LKHAFRNAMLPIVTIVGLQVGHLVCRRRSNRDHIRPGRCGTHALRGYHRARLPHYPGFTIVIAVSYVFINLLIDLSYVFIDPRIRLD